MYDARTNPKPNPPPLLIYLLYSLHREGTWHGLQAFSILRVITWLAYILVWIWCYGKHWSPYWTAQYRKITILRESSRVRVDTSIRGALGALNQERNLTQATGKTCITLAIKVPSGAHEPPKAAKERATHGYPRVPCKYKSWERASSNDFHIWKLGAH